MKVSIILPARNEEKLITASLTDIYKYLEKKQYSFEILVVINGSSDKTLSLVENFVTEEKTGNKIKILKSKAGYGYALRQGLKEAEGNYVVVFNVDFYDLKLVELINIDLYGRDFIIGSKRAHWSKDRRPMSRKLMSYLFNLYLTKVHGFVGSDTHGIKIFNKKVLKTVLSKCKTFTGIFDTEFVLRAQYAGFKMADFPVIVEEKRSTRFVNRLIDTPVDMYKLFMSLR